MKTWPRFARNAILGTTFRTMSTTGNTDGIQESLTQIYSKGPNMPTDNTMKLSKSSQVGRYSRKSLTGSSLKKKLDRIFSEYIRLRDSYCIDGLRVFLCISCGKIKTTDQMQAGHFMSRRHLSTRYDERNVNGQCIACNYYGQGIQFRHGMNIDKKHGAGTAELLEVLSKTKSKLTDEWYNQSIERYKHAIKQLKGQE